MNGYKETSHFTERQIQRGIRDKAIQLALKYGLSIRNKGAMFRVLTRKICQKLGLDKAYHGVTVVLDGATGTLITVYRYFGESLAYFRKGNPWRRA